MKNLTEYGECPSCGAYCQPDVVSHDDSGDTEEYCICGHCELMWTYVYNMNECPEAWESAWAPIDIDRA